MRMMRPFLAIVATTVAPLSAAQPPPLSALLERASTYVAGFVEQFSSVVADEHYVQDERGRDNLDPVVVGGFDVRQHVELESDFLFVRVDDDSRWLTFRDVYRVDGRTVRDREERLTRLFMTPSTDAFVQAREISRDGYRYNLGSRNRTVANPMLALGFLQPDYRDRFEFSVAGIDRASGSDTWILNFHERVRPTILRSADGRDVSTTGKFWIDGATGRVKQTELDTNVGDRILTIFGQDPQLQIDVPLEMRDITWFNRQPITGKATYSKFRRFTISTDEKFKKLDK